MNDMLIPDEDRLYDEPDDEKDDLLPYEAVEEEYEEESGDTPLEEENIEENEEDLTEPEVLALAEADPGEYINYVAKRQGKQVFYPNKLSYSHNKVRRTLADRERDLATIANFYLKGMTQQQISDELSRIRPYNIRRQQIHRDIQELHHRWQNSYLTSINELKVRELAKIDRLEAEYWDAWDRSKRDFVSMKQDRTADESMIKTKVKNEDGKDSEATVLRPSFSRTKTTTEKEERVGDPRFLEGVERCIDKRIRVLGLEPSKSININWRRQAEAEGINPENVVNGLVEQFISAAAAGLDGGSGAGSLGESPDPDSSL